MLKATTFSYDGIFSGQYGLMIAGIDEDYVQDTTPFNYTVHAVKTKRAKRFSFSGIENEEMPQFQFSVISETPIPDIIRRELLRWLVGRNGFRKLQLHQPDYQDYEYNCIFAQAGLKYINGECHGINLTATFDSPYAYGRANKKTITSDGTDWVSVKIINDSDIVDDYIYPVVKFNAPISIINATDNVGRIFEYDNMTLTEKVEIDNELKIITSNIGGDKLGNFNLNWLRLIRGVNELRIQINGTCTIQWPTLIKIGF